MKLGFVGKLLSDALELPLSMPVESGKLKLNLKGGTPWIEKKKKKKKSKAPEVDTVTDEQETGAQEGKAGPTTTSKAAPPLLCCHVICTNVVKV